MCCFLSCDNCFTSLQFTLAVFSHIVSHKWPSGMGGWGFGRIEPPKQKLGGGGGGHSPPKLVPKLSLAQHKNWKNIQSHDLFTNHLPASRLAK